MKHTLACVSDLPLARTRKEVPVKTRLRHLTRGRTCQQIKPEKKNKETYDLRGREKSRPRPNRCSFTIARSLARHQKFDLPLKFRNRNGSKLSLTQLLVELRQPGSLESGPLRDARLYLLT